MPPESRSDSHRPAAAALTLVLLALLLSLVAPGAVAQTAGNVFLPIISRPAVFRLDPVGSFNFVTAIAGGPGGWLLVGERDGRVWSLDAAGTRTAFLDISGRVVTDGLEQGLLGLAFDPSFDQNGFVYVSYTTRRNGANHVRVSRFQVPPGATAATSSSEVILLSATQDSQVHHGGGLAFGPRDGWLYAGIGEGLRSELAQRADSARGKVLRLATGEIANGTPPPPQRWLDAEVRVRTEVWAAGLRNPWRIAFDPHSGDLFVGDAGFRQWEEVDVIPDGRAGLNFGWPCREGPATLSVEGNCAGGGFEPPIYAYEHTGDRCVIIGGAVSRPTAADAPRYVAGDFCSREIFLIQPDGATWEAMPLGHAPNHFLTTFGQDAAGHIYAGTMGQDAPIYRLTLP